MALEKAKEAEHAAKRSGKRHDHTDSPDVHGFDCKPQQEQTNCDLKATGSDDVEEFTKEPKLESRQAGALRKRV